MADKKKKTEKRERQSVSIKKKLMVEALTKSLGVVTTASKAIGVERRAHYRWMASDPEYKKAVEDILNISIDFAESKLYECIANNYFPAIKWFLECKGAKRGWRPTDTANEVVNKLVKWADKKTEKTDE